MAYYNPAPRAVAQNPKFDYLVKLLLIGDSGVGKSCLLLRYCDDAFAESFITTIGIDFKVRTVELNGKRVRVQIWDTAGQERFQTILPAYYRNAHGIALVFDVTDAKSFENVSHWIKSIDAHAQANVQKIIIANKADFVSERVVSAEQAAALSKQYDTPLFETSAKANVNVTLAIESLISAVITKAPPVAPKPALPPVKVDAEKPCAAAQCAK